MLHYKSAKAPVKLEDTDIMKKRQASEAFKEYRKKKHKPVKEVHLEHLEVDEPKSLEPMLNEIKTALADVQKTLAELVKTDKGVHNELTVEDEPKTE